LADQTQHIGKCYLGLHQYAKAQPYYREALRLYKNDRGGLMGEAVSDYATVLRRLGADDAATRLVQQFNMSRTVDVIP
ncbi:MAG TPA: tetratricopeptide repeat protein, partial [Candidatus Obscuribacterales bacterium]